MSDTDKPKVDLMKLAEEFSVKAQPEDPDEQASRERKTKDDGTKTKRLNRMKAVVLGNVGNTGGG